MFSWWVSCQEIGYDGHRGRLNDGNSKMDTSGFCLVLRRIHRVLQGIERMIKLLEGMVPVYKNTTCQIREEVDHSKQKERWVSEVLRVGIRPVVRIRPMVRCHWNSGLDLRALQQYAQPRVWRSVLSKLKVYSFLCSKGGNKNIFSKEQSDLKITWYHCGEQWRLQV